MKKKRVTMAIVVRFGLCLFLLLLLQLSISLISKPKLPPYSSTQIQEIMHGKIKAVIKRDPHPHLANPIICDRSQLRYDLCSINGPTVLDPTTSTFFTFGPTSPTQPSRAQKIRPYPRKYENFIMAQIKDITITTGPPSPSCQVRHNVPALVFSAGGYTGNFFHDFNDGFIPLFITANTILHDRDFVIVVSEAHDWWPSKYEELLQQFTKHPIISLENDTSTHCFPYAKLGLIAHGFMTINQTLMPNSKTFLDFRALLEKAYGENRFDFPVSPNHRPRLLLSSRNGTTGRMIINQNEVIQAMENAGFDVTIFEPEGNTSLQESYVLVKSSHVMVGVHGAALTHSLFLRPGSVMIQVVPIGVEWAANVYFGRVAKGLNLEYMEYKIGIEESSLVEKYGKDNILLKDPHALQKKGWPTEIMDIYLKEQNVKVNMDNFMKYLKEAYQKAKKFMDSEG